MSKPRVLISGASIAGPALAFWLVRAGCSVTLVERASELRTAGQGIDVQDTARDVVKRMGIWDTVKDRSSHEEGTMFIGKNNRVLAKFGIDPKTGEGGGITNDIEILRGELAKILFDVTKDDVKYIFGDMVESLEETDSEVHVKFANGTPNSTFDLVVAADGFRSKIRSMTFGEEAAKIVSLKSYVSYFSIPKGDADTMYSKGRWFDGGRSIFMRPDNVGRTRVFLMFVAYDKNDARLPRFAKAAVDGIPAQKALCQETWQDLGWEASRVLEGMQKSDDFYMQPIAQVKMDRWTSKRVTVVGDAGYAPSPFTGMGTSLAFLGAYILAGEISRQPDNIPAALKAYESGFKPYVNGVQKLPPGIPWIVNPQSALGVRVLETVVRGVGLASKTWIATVFSKIFALFPSGDKFQLPEYEAFKEYAVQVEKKST